MQNEPQLSAEIEIVTKFRQFLADWDYAHITRKVPVEESRQMCDEFALTLATALEEQREEATLTLMNSTKPFFDAGYKAGKKDERAKVLAEVESWLVDEENDYPEPGNDMADWVVEVRNDVRAELRAKLAEMKGGENETT